MCSSDLIIEHHQISTVIMPICYNGPSMIQYDVNVWHIQIEHPQLYSMMSAAIDPRKKDRQVGCFSVVVRACVCVWV